LYRAAVAAADPVSVTRTLLDGVPAPREGANVWIFGAGKAANGMATALLEWLGPAAGERVAGLLVSVSSHTARLPRLEQLVGDHPVPGSASFNASRRLEQLTAAVGPADQVYVLLSGGATSLIGAPVDGIPERDYRLVFELLLGAGLDIREMNAIRKQISRWSAGRLAIAIAPAPVQPLIMSDVESDNPATIGSGPCTFDPAGAGGALDILHERRLVERVPSSVRDFLVSAVERDPRPATSTTDTLGHVSTPRIARHALPVDAADDFARTLGLDVIRGPRLSGEASVCGRELAALLLSEADRAEPETIVISGGETTVTLAGGNGTGGRCQELALSAAQVLAESGGRSVTLLVAGTDGRDGPTDAAGAVVDGSTWSAIASSGRDPARDLRRHDSHPALDAAGALLRTGHSGTNMMDVAIAILQK